MSKYYEQLQNQSNENSSRRLSRRQEVTELDLFAFAAARKAKEMKETEEERQPEPAPLPEPASRREEIQKEIPAPPPPAPLPPPPKTIGRAILPSPEPMEDYAGEEPEARPPARFPISPRRFAEIVFIALSTVILLLAVQKACRHDPGTGEIDEDTDITQASDIPEPDVVVADPQPAPQPPAAPLPVPEPAASFAVPGVVVRNEGDTLVIRFASGIFTKMDELSPEAKRILTLLSREMKPMLADHSMTIVGCTDNEKVMKNKLFKDNAELGMLRARAAGKFLQSQMGLA
ncbi:MAG: hypothetical protein V2A34_15595, partial [Lentisphaerota bacterium]